MLIPFLIPIPHVSFLTKLQRKFFRRVLQARSSYGLFADTYSVLSSSILSLSSSPIIRALCYYFFLKLIVSKYELNCKRCSDYFCYMHRVTQSVVCTEWQRQWTCSCLTRRASLHAFASALKVSRPWTLGARLGVFISYYVLARWMFFPTRPNRSPSLWRLR